MSEVIGKVIVLGNTEEVGQNGFTKRMLVVESSEQYPQKLAIDFVKENEASKVDGQLLEKYPKALEVAFVFQITNNLSYMKLNVGDMRIYKSAADMFKRLTTLSSTGKALLEEYKKERVDFSTK